MVVMEPRQFARQPQYASQSQYDARPQYNPALAYAQRGGWSGRVAAAPAPWTLASSPEMLGAMDTREFDVETQALPLIWDNLDEIADKAQNLIEAANTFADIAAGGDQQATLGGLRALGGACGNCHDTFREDQD